MFIIMLHGTGYLCFLCSSFIHSCWWWLLLEQWILFTIAQFPVFDTMIVWLRDKQYKVEEKKKKEKSCNEKVLSVKRQRAIQYKLEGRVIHYLCLSNHPHPLQQSFLCSLIRSLRRLFPCGNCHSSQCLSSSTGFLSITASAVVAAFKASVYIWVSVHSAVRIMSYIGSVALVYFSAQVWSISTTKERHLLSFTTRPVTYSDKLGRLLPQWQGWDSSPLIH